jgi:hypothetical protein
MPRDSTPRSFAFLILKSPGSTAPPDGGGVTGTWPQTMLARSHHAGPGSARSQSTTPVSPSASHSVFHGPRSPWTTTSPGCRTRSPTAQTCGWAGANVAAAACDAVSHAASSPMAASVRTRAWGGCQPALPGSRPCSSRPSSTPSGCGTCGTPEARRCRSHACTAGVHGPACRATRSSPTGTAPPIEPGPSGSVVTLRPRARPSCGRSGG